MKNGFQKFTAAFIALALISAGVGMVSAAPGSIDGTQTDTSEDVYITDGKTMDTEFNASGDTSWNLTVQSVPDTADLAMNVSHDNETYYEFTGDFGDYDDGDPDTDPATNGSYHAFTDDELGDVPMNINENVTLDVTYWNESAESPTPTTVQVYVNNTDERAVRGVTENASFVDVETKESPAYRLTDDYEAVSVDDENVEVNGTETDIIYTLSDSTVQDPFANVSEDVDSSGAFMLTMADVDAESTNSVPMFYQESPDWYDADSMGSYATYNPSDNTVTLETEDSEFEDATSADVSVSSDVYRIGDVGTVFNLAGGTSEPREAAGAVVSMVM